MASATFVVDTIAPRGALSLVGSPRSDPGYTNTPLVQVSELFGLSDGGFDVSPDEPNGGFVTVRLANQVEANLDTATDLPANASQSWFLDTSGDGGTKTVWMRLTDAAGNRSPDYSATIVLNTLPPSGSATVVGWTGAGTAQTNQSSVQLQYVLSSDTTGIAVSEQPTSCDQLATSAFQPPAGAPPKVSVTLSSGDGLKTLYSCLRNAAGNTFQLATPVVLDTQPPTATLKVGSGAAFQNVGGTVTASFSGASTDTAGMVLSTGALNCATASYVAFSATASVPLGADGAYTVNACLRDAAGNTTALPAFSFTKDTTNPTISSAKFTSLSNPGANATNSSNVGVTFNGFSEPVVAYRISTDQTFAGVPLVPFAADGSAVSTAQSVAYTLPSGDGSKQVYVQVQDRAGNLSSPATALTAVTLDTTPPTATTDVLVGAAVNPAYSNQANVTLRFTVSSDATQVAASSSPMTCSQLAASAYQNLSGTPPTLPFTLLSSATGSSPQSIYVCIRDAAGNTVGTVNSITLDTAAPTASVSVGNGQPIQTGSTFAVVFSGASTDVSKMIVAADNAPNCASLAGYTAYAASSNLNLNDGSHTVYTCLADLAGNTTSLPTVAVMVDNGAPSVGGLAFTGLSNQAASLTNAASVTVSLSGIADATSGVDSVRLSTDPSFAGVPFGLANLSGGVVSGSLNLPYTLPSGDGSKIVYAQVRDRAGNLSAVVQGTVTLDTQPPVWTSAPVAAKLYTNSISVSITLAGTDNIDSTAQLQVGLTPSGSCTGAAYGAYGTGTVSYSPLSVGSNKLLGCLKDRAGNVSAAPSAVLVNLDTTAPLASSLSPNPPVALASGALVSWSDGNSDTEHIEVDASTDPNFASNVRTNKAAVGSCTASGITPPPTSVKVGLSAGDLPLTNLTNWYFRIRAVDCAGNASGNKAVPGSAVPNLGSAPLVDALVSAPEVLTDGPDLWIHAPGNVITATDGGSSGIRQEVVMHCQPGTHDCRDSTNWSSAVVPIDTAAQLLSVGDPNAAPAAMLVTDDTLYLVDSVQDATNGNPSYQRKLAMAYCDRSTNCDSPNNWVANNLVREVSQFNVAASVKGGVSGRALGVFYNYAQFGIPYPNTYLSMARCDRALGTACRTGSNWTAIDTPILLDSAYPLSVAGSDDHFYVGGVSLGAYGATIDARGEPVLINCEGACASAPAAASSCTGSNCGCDGYVCGDFRFSKFSAPATGNLMQSNAPKLVTSAGSVFAAWSERTGPSGGPYTDNVKAATCAGNVCLYGTYYTQATLSTRAAPSNAASSTAPPDLAFAPSGGPQGPAVTLRAAYPDLSAGPALVLASCDATVPSSCGSAANWTKTTLASGPGNDLAVSGAAAGRNVLLLAHNSLGDPVLYQPIVGTSLDFMAAPQVLNASSTWTPLTSASATLFTYGTPSGFPTGATTVTISDPYASSFSLPLTAYTPQRATLTASSSLGLGDPTQSWKVSPFLSMGAPRTDLQASMAVSIASPGAASSGSDPYVYATYLSGTAGLALGRCNSTTDCSSGGNWSWGQANVNTAWNTNQVTLDYPRCYPNQGQQKNQTTASTPRLFTGGRWNGNQLWIEGCVLNGSGTCTSAANFTNNRFDSTGTLPAMSSSAQPMLRAAGDFVETAESDGAQKVIVRYCDGSHTYPHNPCGTSGTTDRALSYCFDSANWKSVTLDGAPYGAATGQQVAGMPHPEYGFMAVQPRVNGGFIFWSCAAATYGYCSLTQNDCSNPANWKANVVAVGGYGGARYLDMAVSSTNFFPTTGMNDYTEGVYVSYFDTAHAQWGVAECRGNPDVQFYSPWVCTQPGKNISGSANAGLGWSFAPVVAGRSTHTVASTVRIINGDVMGSFFEDDRIYLASCPGGAECHRSEGWHPSVVTSSVNTDHSAGTQSAIASWGYLTGGANGDVYLTYPNLNTGTGVRSVNFLTGGALSTP